MGVHFVPTTGAPGGSAVTQPNPTGNAAQGYVVTQTGPASPASTATQPGTPSLAAAVPFNDVVE